METLLLALIVSVISPLILALVSGHQTRKTALADKEADWKRQDELAARGENHTKTQTDLLKEDTNHIKVVVEDAAHAQEEEAVETRMQLSQIHSLVNGDMALARSELLRQTRISLTMLKKIVDLDVEAGRIPHAEDVEAIADMEERITELESIIEDRVAQQRILDRQQRDAEAARQRIQVRIQEHKKEED